MKKLVSLCTRVPLFVWLILISCLYYLLISQNLFVCDDFGYALSLDGSPLKSGKDIIDAQVQHYFTTNGRFLVHCVVMLFAGIWGMASFRLCSTVMFAILVYELYFLCGKKYRSVVPISIIAMMIVLPAFNITFGGNIATVTNYLWTAVFFLAYLIGLEKACNSHLSRMSIVLWSCFAFLSGALQESFSVGCVMGSLSIVWINRRKMHNGLLPLVLCYCFGSALVILAPANFLREMHSNGEIALWYRIVANSMNIISEGYAFVVFGLLLLFTWIHNKQDTWSFILHNIHVFVMIVISLLFAVFIAFNGHHQLTGAYLCVIILFFRWVLFFKEKIYIEYRYLISIFSVIAIVCLYPFIYHYRAEVQSSYLRMYESAENAVDGVFYSQEYDSISYHNQNWIQKHFTSTELNQDFPLETASLFLSKGKYPQFLTTRLPYSKERIISMCSPQNQVSDYTYHQDGTLVYIFCIPKNISPNSYYAHVEQNNSKLGFIRNYLAHRPRPGISVNEFSVEKLPSFKNGDNTYYVFLFKEEFMVVSADIKCI